MPIGLVRKVFAKCSLVLRVVLMLALVGVGVSACKKKEAARADSRSDAQKVGAKQTLSKNASPVEKVLFEKGPSCHECGKDNCNDLMAGCVSIEGVASEGPAKGKSKAELCQNTLGCVLKNRCVSGDASFKCFCGKLTGEDCLTGGEADGPCKSVIEAGLETTSAGVIGRIWGERTTGGGAAMALVHCLIDRSCKTCF